MPQLKNITRHTSVSLHLPNLASIFLLLMLVLLVGCGKRPNHVQPPEGGPDKAFPATYPYNDDDSL